MLVFIFGHNSCEGPGSTVLNLPRSLWHFYHAWHAFVVSANCRGPHLKTTQAPPGLVCLPDGLVNKSFDNLTRCLPPAILCPPAHLGIPSHPSRIQCPVSCILWSRPHLKRLATCPPLQDIVIYLLSVGCDVTRRKAISIGSNFTTHAEK